MSKKEKDFIPFGTARLICEFDVKYEFSDSIMKRLNLYGIPLSILVRRLLREEVNRGPREFWIPKDKR